MNLRYRVAATITLVVGLLVTGAARQAPADARFEKIAALVQAQMTEHAVPGVAIGILDEGRVTTRAFGITNVDHPLP